MIALVAGTVAVRRTDHVVVDCGGVGYRLAVSSETLRHVPAVGHEVTLHSHLVVRDDAAATIHNIAAHELPFRFGIVCDLIAGSGAFSPRWRFTNCSKE